MRQLVRQQALTPRRRGLIAALVEHNVLPHGVSERVDGACRLRRVIVGVNAHTAEVVPEARFHERARARIQWPARRLQRIMHDRRHMSDTRGGRRTSHEAQIIRELSTHKPIVSSFSPTTASAEPIPPRSAPLSLITLDSDLEMPSLLEIGRRAAMQAEREVIERVLAQTRWNRRQAAKILKISYKALLNKLKAMEEHNGAAAAKNIPA